MLCKQFCLYFVQIHAVVSRDESLDEDDVCFCENVRVTNMPMRMWVIGDSIVMVIHKALIHKALVDVLRIALGAAPATQTISFEEEEVLRVRSGAIGVRLEPD
jgi:hypothetical protein